MSGLLQIAIATVTAVGAYAVISRGLFRATEPFRREALDLAIAMLNSDSMPEREKWRINAALDDLHSALAAWRIAVSAFTLLFVLPFKRTKKMGHVAQEVPAEFQRSYVRFVVLWNLSTIGNSPLAALLFAPSSLIIVAFSMSTSLVSRAIMNGRNPKDDHHHHNGHAHA